MFAEITRNKMNRHTLFFSRWMAATVCCALLACSGIVANAGTDLDLDGVLREVHKKIADKEQFKAIKQKRIDTIKEQIIRQEKDGRDAIDEYNALIGEYFSYSSDSTEYYLRKILPLCLARGDKEGYIRNLLLIAWNNAQNGKWIETQEIIRSIKREDLVSNDLLERYYNTLWSFYNNYCSLNPQSPRFNEMRVAYRDSMMMYCDRNSETYTYACYEKRLEEKKYHEAEALIHPLFEEKSPNRGRAAYCLACIYKEEGRLQEAIYHLAYASAIDLKNGVMDNKDIYELGLLLYNEGDIDLAYECINSSLEDALVYNSNARINRISNDLPVIKDSYMGKIKKEKSRASLLAWLSTVTAILLACLTAFTLYQLRIIRRSRRLLKRTNEKLLQLNEEIQRKNSELDCINVNLTESNAIKDKYIVEFLVNCSEYIDKLNAYRFSLLKIANAGKYTELTSTLRSSSYTDAEIHTLMKNFDTVFLSLVPEFVPGVNQLLKAEARFDEGQFGLNTELRILALIRIGITDSVLISRFLRYSVSTIYNYRVKMRNNSLGERDEFERKVTQIGKISG